MGSSPRVWGQGNGKKVRIQKRRIIPTRMGTSFYLTICKERYSDHPHAYGDKSVDTLALYITLGSSPRVWGQVAQQYEAQLTRRIIPTRMGTRIAGKEVCVCEKDHPHAYGDKSIADVSRSPIKGSSPRVWGQAVFPPQKAHCWRIIPTRMGTSGPDKQP